MPRKSSHEMEDSDEYIRRKIRKIEKKLRERKQRSRQMDSRQPVNVIVNVGGKPMNSNRSNSRTECRSPELLLSEDRQDPVIMDSVVHNEQPDPVTLNADLEPAARPSTLDQLPEECTLDNEILELLGASPLESRTIGDNIHKDIALRWKHIVTTGLTREVEKALVDKHPVPANCLDLGTPLLNPELRAALPVAIIDKDRSMQRKQSQVAAIISCIGEAVTNIFQSNYRDSVVIKSLLESAQLLCGLQYHESMKRRILISENINKEIKAQINETKIDRYLFGENLGDVLKVAIAINKSANDIKATRPRVETTQVPPCNSNQRPQVVNFRYPATTGQVPATYTQSYTPQTTLPSAISSQWRQQYTSVPQPVPPPPPPSMPKL